MRIRSHTVGFLVVHSKVLDTGTHTVALHTTYVGGGNLTRHQRVFGIILEVTSAKRVTVNVQRRSQQHVRTVFQHFVTDGPAYTFHQFLVPGRGEQSPDREMSTIVCSRIPLTLGVDTQSGGTIGQHHGGNAETLDRVGGSCRARHQLFRRTDYGTVTRETCHTSTYYQMSLFFQGHGANHLIQRGLSKLRHTRSASRQDSHCCCHGYDILLHNLI